MTLYHLRKVINKRQAYLKWSNPDCQDRIDINSLFTRLYQTTNKVESSLEALEQIVALHRSLLKFHNSDSTQAIDVEETLYDLLGLELAIPSITDDEALHTKTTITSHTWGEIEESIQSLFNQYQSMMPSQQVIQLLRDTRPTVSFFCLMIILESGQVLFRGPKSKYLSHNNFKCYTAWMEDFMERCRQYQQQLPADAAKDLPSSTPEICPSNKTVIEIPPHPSEQCEVEDHSTIPAGVTEKDDWTTLHCLIQSIVVAKTHHPALNYRILVKITNQMLTKARTLFSAQAVHMMLVEARPMDIRCQSFQTTSDGLLKYQGDSLKLVTTTQFDSFKTWILCFSGKCYGAYKSRPLGQSQ